MRADYLLRPRHYCHDMARMILRAALKMLTQCCSVGVIANTRSADALSAAHDTRADERLDEAMDCDECYCRHG